MVIALYGIALAMVAAGLAAVLRGYEFIVVERGWTMVIAGTMAASSGMVLFGIAYAAGRINRLAGEMARVRDRAGRAEVPFPPPPLTLGAPAPAPLPAGSLDLPEPPARPVIAPSSQAGLVSSGVAGAAVVGAAASSLREDEPAREDEGEAEPRTFADPRPSAGGATGPVSELDGPRDLDGTAEFDEPAADRAEPAPLATPAAAEPPALQDDAPPYDDGLFADEAEPASPPPARPADAALLAEEDAGALPAEPRDGDAPRDEAAPEAEAPAPVVVGTYSSGGNNYVMYADGSIEADTPEGLFKFASLDELKEFIASGGEEHGARR